MSSLTSILPSWRPRSGADWARLALGCAIVGLVYYAYWVVKVGKDLSTYRWLIVHWQVTSNYSHGPLIPLMAGALLWWKRRELWAVRLSPVNAGVGVLVAAMFLYYIGIKAVEPRTSVSSFVLLLYGLTLALGGRELFKVLFFPITFLLLMIPLNFLDEFVGFPLRQFVAGTTVSLLNWFGIEAYRMGNGTGIYSSVFRFDVADPCSGIRSLMALTTVTAFYGYITQHQQWKRWVLFLSAMPLAVLGNLARVLSIALVAEVYGQDLATKIYHDWSGFILFPVALTAMVIIGLLMNFPYRRVLQNWLKPLPVAERPSSEQMSTVTPRETL
jgi:exosortase